MTLGSVLMLSRKVLTLGSSVLMFVEVKGDLEQVGIEYSIPP